MRTYNVIVKELVTYELKVRANNADKAFALADKNKHRSDIVERKTLFKDFDCWVIKNYN
jgi:hypothetical protein